MTAVRDFISRLVFFTPVPPTNYGAVKVSNCKVIVNSIGCIAIRYVDAPNYEVYGKAVTNVVVANVSAKMPAVKEKDDGGVTVQAVTSFIFLRVANCVAFPKEVRFPSPLMVEKPPITRKLEPRVIPKIHPFELLVAGFN